MGIINNWLDVFCSSSGQKVSMVKTQLLVYRNVHNSRVMELSCISSFSLTSDLGKYLEVPTLHGRKKNETYAYLFEKIQCCLTKTVVIVLPTYTMQTILPPKQVCDKLATRMETDYKFRCFVGACTLKWVIGDEGSSRFGGIAGYLQGLLLWMLGKIYLVMKSNSA
ncbi:hypothetical protein CR513_33773, partial [Mucuna pruriens]